MKQLRTRAFSDYFTLAAHLLPLYYAIAIGPKLPLTTAYLLQHIQPQLQLAENHIPSPQ